MDRGRFYAILDTAYTPEDQWVQKARELLAGGADLIQLRAKGVSQQEVRKKLEAILPLQHEFPVPFILNDDAALAAEYPTVGLHIGQDDMSLEKARDLLGPDRWIGLSTHSLSQARAALDKSHLLHYFATGPVFATQTKPEYTPVGLKLVNDVAQLNPALLWFCIGGINRINLAQVLQEGARNVVAVSDPLLDPDTTSAVQTYKKILSTSE